MKGYSLVFIGFMCFILNSCGDGQNEKVHYLKIGTGALTGVYYTEGLALAQLLNKEVTDGHLNMSVESTAGSVFNVNALEAGELDFALVQSDQQYKAYHGQGIWEGEPKTDLRFILSLHEEAVTFVASDESEIKSLADVVDHVVSVGAPGSGTRGNALDCLRVAGISLKQFYPEALGITNASLLLQDGRLDGFFYTVGHPNGSIMEATNGRIAVHFVPIEHMEPLLEKAPFYFVTKIPIADYPKASNKTDVPTIGVLTTLLTTSHLSEQEVYELTKSVFTHLTWFKQQHPALKLLTPKAMANEGAFIPFHPGALRYYREEGLIDDNPIP